MRSCAPDHIVSNDGASLPLLEWQHLISPDAGDARAGIDNAAHAAGKEHQQSVVEIGSTGAFLGVGCTEAQRVGNRGPDDLSQFRCDVVVARLVIAVPTSIGYGANFGGVAPLLAMLNSCASGVAVMNIDNGFGAGFAASLVNQS